MNFIFVSDFDIRISNLTSMDVFSPTQIREIMARHGAKPSKFLGQNFLIDTRVLEKIIVAAKLEKTDTVLEVGPGIGVLTRALAKNVGKVVAIEKDRALLPILHETTKEFNNIETIHGDILKLDPMPYTLDPYKVVANIPYYITSPLIRKFLEAPQPPSEMVLMIQKEVAQRICAKPPEMSLLAVSVQFYADTKIISQVSKNCFWPAPNVDSAIIKIIPRNDAEIYAEPRRKNADEFFKVVRAGFSHPRKQLINNFCTALSMPRKEAEKWLAESNIQSNQRAETLSVQDWVGLTMTMPKK